MLFQLGKALKQIDRPQYIAPAQISFSTIEQYLTAMFYGTEIEREAGEASKKAFNANIRFVPVLDTLTACPLFPVSSISSIQHQQHHSHHYLCHQSSSP